MKTPTMKRDVKFPETSGPIEIEEPYGSQARTIARWLLCGIILFCLAAAIGVKALCAK